MKRHRTAVCCQVIQHQQHAHGRRSPASLSGQEAWNDARFPREGCDGRLRVQEATLHLDERQRAVLRTPTDHVHRAALAVAVEAVLDHRLPACRRQDPHNAVHKPRVVGVEQADAIPTAPLWREGHPDLESRRDSPDMADRRAIQLTGFDLRDDLLADVRPGGHLRLRPAKPMSDRAHERSDAEVVHGAR